MIWLAVVAAWAIALGFIVVWLRAATENGRDE